MKQMQMFQDEQQNIRRYPSYDKPAQIVKDDDKKDFCPKCNVKLKSEATGFRCLQCGYFIDRY